MCVKNTKYVGLTQLRVVELANEFGTIFAIIMLRVSLVKHFTAHLITAYVQLIISYGIGGRRALDDCMRVLYTFEGIARFRTQRWRLTGVAEQLFSCGGPPTLGPTEIDSGPITSSDRQQCARMFQSMHFVVGEVV